MTSTTNTAAKIVKAILRGQLDPFLPQIADAAMRRRQAIALEQLASLSPGDKVRFSRNCKPKYLAGQTATVTEVGGDHVYVDMDRRIQRGRKVWHENIRCPATIVEKI